MVFYIPDNQTLEDVFLKLSSEQELEGGTVKKSKGASTVCCYVAFCVQEFS